MQEFPGILAEARLWQIVALSLEVSLTAVVLAAAALSAPSCRNSRRFIKPAEDKSRAARA